MYIIIHFYYIRMKTRSASKKIPQIIQIQSENSYHSVEEFKKDDSCSSSVSDQSCSSVQSNSRQFFNLAPTDENKKKRSRTDLKQYLIEHQVTGLPNPEEQPIKRAPILDLLRPLQKKLQGQKDQEQQQNSQQSSSVPSPQQYPDSLHDEQVLAMSQPKKKPKLMDELEQQINRPTSEYVITGMGQKIRKQRKKENKKINNLIEKKTKEYFVGKKRDTVSNQVYNAIEDFFA